MKHTKGPWIVNYQGNYPTSIHSVYCPKWTEIYPAESSGERIPICSFLHADDHDYTILGEKLLTEVNTANATLMAAAPEMLNLLEAIDAHMDAHMEEQWTDFGRMEIKLVGDLKRLIKKARGET